MNLRKLVFYMPIYVKHYQQLLSNDDGVRWSNEVLYFITMHNILHIFWARAISLPSLSPSPHPSMFKHIAIRNTHNFFHYDGRLPQTTCQCYSLTCLIPTHYDSPTPTPTDRITDDLNLMYKFNKRSKCHPMLPQTVHLTATTTVLLLLLSPPPVVATLHLLHFYTTLKAITAKRMFKLTTARWWLSVGWLARFVRFIYLCKASASERVSRAGVVCKYVTVVQFIVTARTTVLLSLLPLYHQTPHHIVNEQNQHQHSHVDRHESVFLVVFWVSSHLIPLLLCLAITITIATVSRLNLLLRPGCNHYDRRRHHHD